MYAKRKYETKKRSTNEDENRLRKSKTVSRGKAKPNRGRIQKKVLGTMGRNRGGNRKMKKVNWTYVDMDGVIADFFKALALEFGVNHWKDIPTQEDVIERLKGTDFFSRIPIFPTTIKFLHMVERYTKGRWSILSTPLKGDEENSSKHKDIWLDNLFGYAFDNDFNKKRIYSDKKWRWATAITNIDRGITHYQQGSYGEPNLLIDDRPTNLEEFKEKGGLTIRYQANESKLDKFEQKLKDLFQPLATKELQHG